MKATSLLRADLSVTAHPNAQLPYTGSVNGMTMRQNSLPPRNFASPVVVAGSATNYALLPPQAVPTQQAGPQPRSLLAALLSWAKQEGTSDQGKMRHGKLRR